MKFSLLSYLWLMFLLVLNLMLPVQAANSESEKRWAEQLRDNIVTGEAIDLPADNSDNKQKFFAIYTAHTTPVTKGAIILMHGTGAHPDWADIIHPLRTELPDKGWATLSIQLPLLEPEKDDNESKKKVIEASVSRINDAISFLKAKSYTDIALISHSFGSLMALNYCQADKVPYKIKAAIVIGTSSPGQTIPLNSPAMVEKIKIPLLDLYGSEDLAGVLLSSKARKTAAHKSGNKKYRQVETIGANHFYSGLEDELLIYVSGWLKKNI
ncbi:MAG: alpha/beta hydrolase family protein [gamma proteobacterium symbiont of Taylorina sp.]|nr:alpha/beta hydrolase family protein [gamma proteobacterium symbiont of Taylorina sp.]